MSAPAYESYKDSGVEWLGQVPSHWAIKPLKADYAVFGGATPKSDQEQYWDGTIPWVTPADLSRLITPFIGSTLRTITDEGLASSSASLVPSNSVILSTRAPIGSLGITRNPAATNQGCKALVARDGAASMFLFYALSVATEQLQVRGKGTTFLELSGDELGRFTIPSPPAAEQTAIAAFLDRETGKIDALIEAQTRLIELLKEKRQAVISHAVTKGLNPGAPMKDSGIEWLGQVPAHWEVGKLGYFSKLQSGFAFSSDAFGTDGVAVVRMNNLNRGQLEMEHAAKIPEDQCVERVSLSIGDLLIGMSGSIGETGSLGNYARVSKKDLPCQLNQRVGRFINKESKINTDFLELYIQSLAFQDQVINFVTGTAQFNISAEQIQSCIICRPPMSEQENLAKIIKKLSCKHESLIAEAHSAVSLLKERRAALISAAVTGKIDVRGLVNIESEAA